MRARRGDEFLQQRRASLTGGEPLRLGFAGQVLARLALNPSALDQIPKPDHPL